MTPVQVRSRSFILWSMAALVAGFWLVGPAPAQPTPADAQRKAALDARQAAVAAAQAALAAGQTAQAATLTAQAAGQNAAAWGQKAAAAGQQAAAARQQAVALGQQADAAWKVVDHLRKQRKPTQEAEKTAQALRKGADDAHRLADQAHGLADGVAKKAAEEQGKVTGVAKQAQAAVQNQQAAATKAQAAAQHATVEAQKVLVADLQGKEANVLMSVYLLLGTANSEYHGHKRAAMNNVESAIRHLDARILHNGTLQQRTNALAQVYNLMAKKAAVLTNLGPGLTLTDVLSDSQLRQARGLLMNVGLNFFVRAKQVGGMGHINAAIQEIDLALATSTMDAIRGKEADILTAAYALLAGANHDYNGHRAAAMSQVESAINILDNHLVARGSYQQKVQAMKRQITEGVTRELASQQGVLHEDQTLSDAQMMMGGAMIQRVALVMAQRNQTYPLLYLTDGLTEIAIALTIR